MASNTDLSVSCATMPVISSLQVADGGRTEDVVPNPMPQSPPRVFWGGLCFPPNPALLLLPFTLLVFSSF